ncbi:MAG: YceI family protein [Saprospiraceae bacterium]|nr:YceI family protein [Saprospiraceae bacterium]
MESTSIANATKTKWVLDPTHSEIVFKVKHLMITNVKGEFRTFHAEITSASTDFTKASIHANIDAASVFTNEDNRDNHLRSADFFDVANFPQLTFEGTAFEHLSGENYRLTGNLTIKDATHPVTLDVEFGGINTDPWGNEKAGFSLSGSINRKAWGLNWNAALEAGGVLVSEEVKIGGELQFVKQA